MLIEPAVLLADARPVLGDGWIAGPGIDLLREHPKFGRRLRSRPQIHVWTVNTREDLDLCRRSGWRP